MESWTYELSPALAAIRPAATHFREWASARVGPSAAADCELALVEACNNLLMHSDVREVISLRAEANAFELALVVRDRTAGFEWPASPRLPDAAAEHGRGIFLMHALMTEVRYERNDGWNELRLRRRL
jgi:anti-sigma regulatory factor (Ser/Thr protein kinase)